MLFDVHVKEYRTEVRMRNMSFLLVVRNEWTVKKVGQSKGESSTAIFMSSFRVYSVANRRQDQFYVNKLFLPLANLHNETKDNE